MEYGTLNSWAFFSNPKIKEAGTKPPLKWKQPMKFWNEISWAVFHFFNKK